MSIQFQCPACLRQLVYEPGESAFLTCRHCKSQIIVPSTVIHQYEALEAKPTKYSLEEQRNIKLAEVQRELNAGRKVTAIKVFKEAFDTSLADAKDAVELLEHGYGVPTEAVSNLSPESADEQSIYPSQATQDLNPARGAPIIFWIIVSIGIAIALIFWGDS